MSQQRLITAIICTHNRERFLEQCIRSLLVQTLDRDLYEIMVVDNGSTDGTLAICERFRAEQGFRYIFEPKIGLSQARNTGWRQAAGKYVGFLDDDAVAGSQWLEAALGCFENTVPQPWWVGGPVELEWEDAPPIWLNQGLHECLGYLYWGDSPRWLEGRERLVGCNSFFVVERLKQLRGFDTRLGRKHRILLSGEETQLQLKIEKAGGCLYYHPDIMTKHYVPRERMLPEFYYNRYYWGGYTDVVIRKSLAPGMGGEVQLPSAGPDQEAGIAARLRRLAGHALAAAGLAGGQEKAIQGRIYLAYVAGSLRGLIAWHSKRMA